MVLLSKRFTIVALALLSAKLLISQSPIPLLNRSEAFSSFDYSSAPTGFFRDISVEPIDMDSFDGTVLSDSNYVNILSLAALYNSIQTSDVSNRDWSFILPQGGSGTVPLLIALYEYNYISEDALDMGAVSNTSGILRRVNYSLPCYGTKYLFALSPIELYSQSKNVYFQFRFLPNKNVYQQSLELDADDGLGFRNVLGVSGVDVYYSTPGLKEIILRASVNGKYLVAHTQLLIEEDALPSTPVPMGGAASSYPSELVSCNYQGESVSALVEYRYASGDSQLRKPLIYVEGYDAWDLLGENSLGSRSLSEKLVSKIDSLDTDYDIVYVNWINSEADIRANAALLTTIIKEKVNNIKVSDTPSVIIGESMGGLIVRYALCKIEAENKVLNVEDQYDYQIAAFISQDAPHLGASIPVSLLYAVRAILDYFEQLDLLEAKWAINPPIILKHLNGMAAKQMLYNYVDENSQINNQWYNSFQTELSSMGGFPSGPLGKPIKLIALSEGGESGVANRLLGNQNHYIDAELTLNTILTKLSWNVLDPLIVNKLSVCGGLSWYFWLPGDSSIHFSLRANPDNETSAYLMRFKGWYEKKLLWLGTSRDDLVSITRTTRSIIPEVENTYGSILRLDLPIASSDSVNNTIPWYVKLFIQIDSLEINNRLDRILFVPTESALASKVPNYSKNHSSSRLVPIVDTDFDSYQIPNPYNSLPHISLSHVDVNWLRYELSSSIVGSAHGMSGYSYSVSSLPLGIDSSNGYWYSSNNNIAEIDQNGVLTVHSNGRIKISFSFYDSGIYYGVARWIDVSTESDVTSIQLYLDGALDNGCYYARVNPLTNADRINWNLAMQDSVVRQNCTYNWRYMLDFGALRNSESGTLAELYDDLEEGEFPSLSIMPMLRDANNIIRVFFTVSEHLGETTKSKTISKAFYVDDLNAQLWPQSLIVNPNQIMAVYDGSVQDVFLSPPPRLTHQNSVASVSILDEEGVELTELPVESEGYVQLFDNDEVLDFLDEVLIQNEEMTVLRFILKDASGQVLEERTLPILVKDVTYEAL